MAPIRVTYFEFRGRAQAIRLMLVDQGVDFEDRRIPFEEWGKLKESGEIPLKQIPMLEMDGRKMIHSRAILRHLSRKYGYNGTTEEQAFKIDTICETLEDLNRPMWNVIFGKFDEAQKAKMKAAYTATMPVFLKFLETALEENPDGNGYFVGKDATMADFVYYSFIESLVNVHPQALDDYPRLRANRTVFGSRDKIAAYLAKQTPTHM